ncbi:MAG TPA: carbohydrate binding domain-containing protein [Pyrinomonadaceae bacterium]|nr:carbohydrate binding domain-containing protein [Pyrinomonadaceae bacterium]
MNKSAFIKIVAAIVCLAAIWEAGRIGISRTVAIRALGINDEALAEESTRLSPNDAEVHAARGVVLQRTEKYAEACRELERAVQLRPRDYFLWIQLGVTRDLNEDQEGALAAMRQAVAWAPSYAKPRWFIGNLLIRTGQIDEAFQQLRFAAQREPSLLPNVIDLGWGISGNDPSKTIELIQPQTDRARMALATFLAAHGRGSEAVAQFRAATTHSVTEADQLTERLIQSRFFAEAYEVWSKAHCAACKPNWFVNGSFEEEIDVENPGFGWQVSNDSGATLSVDNTEHENGARSLRIDFRGMINTPSLLISQLVVVKPHMRYRVSFHAKAKSFVSAAGPLVQLIDASDEKLPVLGQSALRSDADDWQPYAIYFSTGANTHAIRVVLTRQACPGAPCAAFGTLWLDSFFLDEGYEVDANGP